MPHLDEGTIHSWLDGALSSDEAVRVEAHVTECPQCAAAVAEGRGFIAASSRILTALDNAPRGVVPVATPVKRSNRVMWRAAAAVLVVAVGGLVVAKGGGYTARTTKAVLDAPSPVAEAANARGQVIPAAPPTVAMSRTAPARVPEAAFTGKKLSRPKQSGADTRESAVPAGIITGPVARSVAAAVSADVASDAVSEAAPLRVVSTNRRIGETRTTYELAPGDTVTLIERFSVSLNEIVVTGAATSGVPQSATRKSAGSAKATANATVGSAPDTQRMMLSAPTTLRGAAARAAVQQIGALNGFNTITWSDAGKSLILSGRLTVARLEEVRHRIEGERAAAAAAAKKSP